MHLCKSGVEWIYILLFFLLLLLLLFYYYYYYFIEPLQATVAYLLSLYELILCN